MIDERDFMEFMTALEEAGAESVSFSDLRKFIDEQPKIREWIPCSERLPEIGSSIIVTDDTGDVWDNITYYYADEYSSEPCFHNWDNNYLFLFKPNVIAWMPLPEAYQPKEEKKDEV